IAQAQKSALDELFEQYFGPGVVGAATAKRVLAAFPQKSRERRTLELFLLADRLASGDSTVATSAVRDAIPVAEELGSPGAAAFFRAVWAQMTCSKNAHQAFKTAMDAIRALEPLASGDVAYQTKLGQLAMLASQISEIAGEPQAGLLLRVVHAEQIEQFKRSERD